MTNQEAGAALPIEDTMREKIARAIQPLLDQTDHAATIAAAIMALIEPVMEENERYHELLFAVSKKFEGEDRHETALRYIRERENIYETGRAALSPKSEPMVCGYCRASISGTMDDMRAHIATAHGAIG
jgi:RNase P subunit RPR2